MKTAEIRSQFLEYFRSQGHSVLPSSSLVPENDNALWFVELASPSTTDGTSVVHFRTSDVVSVGDVLDLTGYPRIDVKAGGSIDAVVDNFRLLIAAGGIAPAQIAYWDDVMAKVVQTEEWRKDLEAHTWENTYLNSRDTRKYLDEQYRELRGALAEVGLAK